MQPLTTTAIALLLSNPRLLAPLFIGLRAEHRDGEVELVYETPSTRRD